MTIMTRLASVAAFGTILAMSPGAPAGAQVAATGPVAFSYSSSFGQPAYTTAPVFEDFTNSTGNTPFGTIHEDPEYPAADTNFYSEQSTGIHAVGSSMLNASPTNAYLVFGSSRELLIAFQFPVQFFSFDFYESAGTRFTVGFDLNGQYPTDPGTFRPDAVDTFAAQPRASGNIAFDRQGQSGITGVLISVTGGQLGLDNIAAALPEPSMWAMMILGFGIAGAGLRRHRATIRISHA